jgi:prophage antirepressor-like protein
MADANNFYATTNLEAEAEQALEIENWMVSENNFYATVTFEAETKEALEIENWMTSESNFYNTISLEPETEKVLEIESWMKNDTLFETQKLAEVKKEEKSKTKKAYGSRYGENKFGRRAFIMIEEDGPKLKLEQWMLDYKYWNENRKPYKKATKRKQ